MCDAEYEVVYRKKDGEIRNLKTGDVTRLHRMHGVYFVELSVSSDLLVPPVPKPEHKRDPGFARLG